MSQSIKIYFNKILIKHRLTIFFCKSTPTAFWGVTATRTCQTACPLINQYGDPVDRVCKSCHSTCRTCTGGKYLLKKFNLTYKYNK